MEASGGVGTKLARIVFEPFPVAAEKFIGSAAGTTFHKEVGLGTLVPGYTPFNYGGSCDYYPTEAAARTERDSWQYSRNYAIVKFVDWRPSADITGISGAKSTMTVTGTAGGPGDPKNKSGATVQPIDTSLRDAGKAWDEQVKKTLAEEAKKKVELAAKQVQADAKAKADLEAFLKARRKQGSAQ